MVLRMPPPKRRRSDRVAPVGADGTTLSEYRARRRQQGAQSKREQTFRFAAEGEVRDHKGRRPSDPLCDKKTVLVPESSLAQMNPSDKAYWKLKRANFDTVLCWDVEGKSGWTLYERDVQVAEQAAPRLFKASKSTQGTPSGRVLAENFDEFVAKLVEGGNRVAQVVPRRGSSQEEQEWEMLPVESEALASGDRVKEAHSRWLVAVKEEWEGSKFG
eukprot:Hpha_TRINITY_DN8217_c0_g1::TRINITY_DN8217_c0_g1_i1::g.111838::m.111838